MRIATNKKLRLATKTGLFSAFLLVGLAGLLLVKSSPLVEAACQPTGTTYGTDTMTATVPTTTGYSIWIRMQTPSAAANSAMLQVDGNTCYNISAAPGSWTWVNATPSAQVSLASGVSHSLEVIGTSQGVEIDSVLLLANDQCAPTGNGTNCTTNQPVPTTPKLTDTILSPTSISLSWAPGSSEAGGPGIAGYYVFRSTPGGAGATRVATLNSTTTNYTDNSALANTTYTYSVEAYDSGNPAGTATSNAVTLTMPSAADTTNPTATITAPTDGQTVSGNVPITANVSDNVGVTEVQLYIDGVLVNTAGSTSPTSYLHTYSYTWNTSALANGSTHIIDVTALDASKNAGSDEVTNVQVQNTVVIPKPGAPTGVTATATSPTQVNVKWTAPTSGTVSGYYILRSTAGANPVTIGQTNGTTTTYTDSDTPATIVSPNTTYTYSVEAFNTSGVSPVSNTSTVTTPKLPDTTPPTAPTLTATAASSSQINLSWSGATDNVGVTGYLVYRSNGTQLTPTPITSTTYGDTGLTASTAYSYYVKAVDAAKNQSPASNTASATTLASSSGGTKATVQGVVTSSTTHQPLAYVYIRTGNHGTFQGMASTYTNALGQYVLPNITAGRRHVYSYSDRNYRRVVFTKSLPAGTTNLNVTLTPVSRHHTRHHRR